MGKEDPKETRVAPAFKEIQESLEEWEHQVLRGQLVLWWRERRFWDLQGPLVLMESLVCLDLLDLRERWELEVIKDKEERLGKQDYQELRDFKVNRAALVMLVLREPKEIREKMVMLERLGHLEYKEHLDLWDNPGSKDRQACLVMLARQEGKEILGHQEQKEKMAWMELLDFQDLLETGANLEKMELQESRVYLEHLDPKVTRDLPVFLDTKDRLESKVILDCQVPKDPEEGGVQLDRKDDPEKLDLKEDEGHLVKLETLELLDPLVWLEDEELEDKGVLLENLEAWDRRDCLAWKENLVLLDRQDLRVHLERL